MRWILLTAALLVGCNATTNADNMIACKEACLPNGVKQYDEDSGCICNKCLGVKRGQDVQAK